jgi:hypothetical protein
LNVYSAIENHPQKSTMAKCEYDKTAHSFSSSSISPHPLLLLILSSPSPHPFLSSPLLSSPLLSSHLLLLILILSSPLLPPGILKSTCYIDVRWFPFDVQKCDLKFGSWTYNGWLLDLQILDVDISSYIPNGEWDLVGKRLKECLPGTLWRK